MRVSCAVYNQIEDFEYLGRSVLEIIANNS